MLSLAELRLDTAFDIEEVAAITSRLVRCPSVNPGGDEILMARQVLEELRDLGCTVDVVEFKEGRPSIAAVLSGRRGHPRLVLNGHMDTVGVGDTNKWSREPFSGDRADGVVWGRGAVDMKGGLAAQIACARALAHRLPELDGSLVLHFAAGEECGEPGTRSLLRKGYGGDWGVVTEPTHLKLATAAKGVAWYSVTVRGQAAHAGSGSARDPVSLLGGILSALDRYAKKVAKRRHDLLGSERCTVTMIRAGTQHNATAEEVVLTVDRRLLPGDSKDSALAELREAVHTAVPSGSYEVTVKEQYEAFQPAEISESGGFVDHLEQIITEVTSEPVERMGTPYGSDVRHLILDAGMEAVTFGPGDPALMHSVDERINIAQVRDAALVLAMTAMRVLASARRLPLAPGSP